MDLKPEIEIMARFQAIARVFINATTGRQDDSWHEITQSGIFDPEKLREHEEFNGLFARFRESFDKLDEIDETLRYFNNDDDS